MSEFDHDLLELKRPESPEPCRKGWIWITYVGLFLLSIPWYLPRKTQPLLWLGLPYWVLISLLVTVAIALFTVFVIRRYWSENEKQGRLD